MSASKQKDTLVMYIQESDGAVVYMRSINTKKPSYCSERADHTTLYGIAMQHADDGYSKHGNFGCSPVLSTVLTYSPDGSNVYVKRWEF